MKKIFLALLLLFISLPSAAHAGETLTLTAPTHRHLDGTFIDDQLATDLAPSGRLGQVVFGNLRNISTWRIDPALIEDVQAMAAGYTVSGVGDGTGKDVAAAWLAQLNKATRGHRVEAIVYGNPTEYWITKFFPHDRDFFLTVSSKRLSTLLGRGVVTPTAYSSSNYFSLTSSQVRLMNISAARLAASAQFMDQVALENQKLLLVKILNPSLRSTTRQAISYDVAALVNSLRDSVRVSTGKFTITSTQQKLPITITNDFLQKIKVDLIINSTNERIFVSDIQGVEIPGKSKIQVMIPIKVYTSGDSGFTVTLKGANGSVYGQTVTYPLKIAVISPIATWITGAAGLVLLGAAILQSIRRVRRGRKHE